MFKKLILFIIISTFPFATYAKPADINSQGAKAKIQEIMKVHASHKEITPAIVERSLANFLEELDPNKTYFIESDIDTWLKPNCDLVFKIQRDIDNADFSIYQQIFDQMNQAIERRQRLETLVEEKTLPEKVDAKKFKDIPWAKNEQELLTRLMEVRALQIQAAKKLNDDLQDKTLQRIAKQRQKYEEELLATNPGVRTRSMLSKVLKSYASALDSHTSYFTPDEAQQFLINVQQRLFGIGAALRDDINGFRVIKIVEGGPAESGGELKVDDLIIAVDGEPVVGMGITDAVSLIRGEENTPVILTVIREKEGEEGEEKKSETLDITIIRNEVVLKETRYEADFEPYGDGVIAYLRLFSFYQDPESSSAGDLSKALKEIKEKHKVLGVILDLRSNSGGMLSQAVAVTGLFITKGVVVSIKDEEGKVQHLRDLDGTTIWNGPLMVLINRASASASEIVAQTLQDYGRAIIIGDDHSFGKGSFQTFTLNASGQTVVNPEGEYKVTRGRYYTVSGKSPQLTGVQSDIMIPGTFSESEVGEKYSKFPLDTDEIPANFDDDLSDIPIFQRAKVNSMYRFNLQPKLEVYKPYLPLLTKNSDERVENNKNYQLFLEEIKKKEIDLESESSDSFGQNDLQLTEAYNVMKDLILLQKLDKAEAEAIN